MGLRDELQHITADRRQLKQFGLTLGAVLSVLGALALRRGGAAASALLVAAVILLALGMLAPDRLRFFHRWWMRLGLVLGWVMTRVILSILFYGVVTPIGVLGRMFGKDFLGRPAASSASYWVPREGGGRPQDYERQF